MATWKTQSSPNLETMFEVTQSRIGFVTVSIETRRRYDGMRIAHDHVVIPLTTLKEMVNEQ